MDACACNSKSDCGLLHVNYTESWQYSPKDLGGDILYTSFKLKNIAIKCIVQCVQVARSQTNDCYVVVFAMSGTCKTCCNPH